MIKLTDLLKINNMKYSSDVKPKHKKKINMETKLLSNDMLVPEPPFPENSSRHTREELEWLINYNDGKINEDMVKDGDNVLKNFKAYCKENKLNFDNDYYEKILKETTKTILSLKYYYNRPRPYQLGEYYDIPDFKIHKLDSAKTPAYPSGHTTQAYVISGLLSKKYPEHSNEFDNIANFVSESRIMARAHYPSDIKFGMKVAKCILKKIH